MTDRRAESLQKAKAYIEYIQNPEDDTRDMLITEHDQRKLEAMVNAWLSDQMNPIHGGKMPIPIVYATGYMTRHELVLQGRLLVFRTEHGVILKQFHHPNWLINDAQYLFSQLHVQAEQHFREEDILVLDSIMHIQHREYLRQWQQLAVPSVMGNPAAIFEANQYRRIMQTINPFLPDIPASGDVIQAAVARAEAFEVINRP